MKKQRKIAVILSAAVLFACVVFVFTGQLTAANGKAPEEEKAMQEEIDKLKQAPAKAAPKKQMAPDFRLQDIYQDIYTLKQYRNEKPVILFFWTTWCPYCQKELTLLNDMYAGLVKDGFEVLAINVGEYPDTVQNYVKDYYLAYRVLLDKDSAVTYSYELLGIPTYIIVDKEGYIVFKDNFFPQREYKDLAQE